MTEPEYNTEMQDTMNENEQDFSQQENVEEADQRVDWKARAIEAQTRLEMMQQQQTPTEANGYVDELKVLQEQIQEKQASMPQLDDKNPQSFWDRERAKEEIEGLKDQLVEARMRRQERYLAEQQVGTVVQSYKARHQSNPYFQQVQDRFDQMVSRLEPHLRGNEAMLEMVRRNLEYEVIVKNQNQGRVPPTAPNNAYTPQQGQRTSGKVAWKSEADRAVGEMYMQRGIISGPEEYYSQQLNQNSPQANNNGVAIYDVPVGKRGWRR